MTGPIMIDIPHKLGRAGARARLDSGVGQIAGVVPGGSLKEHHWNGDTLTFVIEAMGQRVAAKIDVFEDRVHAVIHVPPLVALFSEKVRAKLQSVGTKLLK